VINDAAMQALGSYKRGKMLFLGLGTGLGSTLIVDGIVEPMELGHLPYKKTTYEDYVGQRALERAGKKKWRRHVVDVIARLVAALEPQADDLLDAPDVIGDSGLDRRGRAKRHVLAWANVSPLAKPR
jgi:predicted NBD/HSP70 family sugar kinase